jgi:catechol 2,3-dioxygenase-like lactoylglutathione lyase family enzyme
VVTLGSIGQIAMPVHDVARAAGFYRDILGLTFLFSAPQLAFFDCAGIRLMLSLPSATGFDHPAFPARRTAWRACPIMTSGWPSSTISTETPWR